MKWSLHFPSKNKFTTCITYLYNWCLHTSYVANAFYCNRNSDLYFDSVVRLYILLYWLPKPQTLYYIFKWRRQLTFRSFYPPKKRTVGAERFKRSQMRERTNVTPKNMYQKSLFDPIAFLGVHFQIRSIQHSHYKNIPNTLP